MGRLAARQAEAEAIASRMGEALREALPSDAFRVVVESGVVSVEGHGRFRGNTWHCRPAHVWLLPLSRRRRLEIIFGSQGKDLQEFVSRVQKAPWPGAGATPGVLVTDDYIDMWWGGASPTESVISCRRLYRKELGV